MLPGIPVHIVQRGNNRQDCFRQEQDRSFYLLHLQRLLGRTGCALHAYCLMTNHVHLLMTAASAEGCARLMKHLGQLHTQYVNRTYGRTGSLWEGRFRSCLVQSEEYALACYRYIELNPVRAGLVAWPGDYPWSSFGANAEGVANPLITPHAEYLRLGNAAADRRLAYRALFDLVADSQRASEIRAATNGNVALGGQAFTREIGVALGRRVERGKAGRPRRPLERDGAQMELLGAATGKNVVCP